MKKLSKRLKKMRNINFDLLEVYVLMALRLQKRLRLFASEPMEREHHNNKLQHFVSERQTLERQKKN